ncbi:hypothetical protein fHeYen801_091 [Yersinia phage fHe-Yen8-01]|nr:hypothetical protein fHeYen801_091 [Yersinia phage fHe-Yen8-01]
MYSLNRKYTIRRWLSQANLPTKPLNTGLYQNKFNPIQCVNQSPQKRLNIHLRIASDMP